MLRAQLPASEHDGRVVFVGPSRMVLEVVRATKRNAVDALSDLPHGSVHTELGDTARAASAWVETFLGCKAVEMFRFDAEADPRLS